MDEEIEFVQKSDEGDPAKEVFEYRASSRKGQTSLKSKVVFWTLVFGGIVIGTLLFLFFLTVLIYLVLPLALILIFWAAIKSMRRR